MIWVLVTSTRTFQHGAVRKAYAMKDSGVNIQTFIPAKEVKPGKPSFCKRKAQGTGELSGEEARAFYESVISEDYPRSHERTDFLSDTVDATTTCSGKVTSSYPVRRTPYRKLVNDFLKFAQEGNLIGLQTLLFHCSIDINVSDQFAWTALMCAAHSGHFHVVKYLLEKGASWSDLKDTGGRTALDLAKFGGHWNIVELLLTYDGHVVPKHKQTHLEEGFPNNSKFWCTVCEQQFTDDQKKHQCSTVHLFNCQRKPQRTFYYIPEDNIGYQMLLNSGWNKEQGLGPDGAGRKYPVKTVLKRDRLGLGSKRSKQPRVTHFGAHDSRAVKSKHTIEEEKKEKKKGVNKKERLTKQKKQKIWETNIRLYMNTE